MAAKKPSVYLPKEPNLRRAALIGALRRAVSLSGNGNISIADYDVIAKRENLPSAMTIRLFFGTWRAALEAAKATAGGWFIPPASCSGAAIADGRAACVVGAAEQLLATQSRFRTMTQFYLSVAVQAAQRGFPLRGKRVCGYDAVPHVLRTVRPDILDRVRRETKAAPGAQRGECSRYLERLRRMGCVTENDLRRERPPKGILVSSCLNTGSKPDTVHRAWRRLRFEAGVGSLPPERIWDLERECAALRRRLERLERRLEGLRRAAG